MYPGTFALAREDEATLLPLLDALKHVELEGRG